MTRSMRTVAGAVIGGIVGYIYVTYFRESLPTGYVPQTQAGVIAGILGRALPWALVGAVAAYLWGPDKKA